MLNRPPRTKPINVMPASSASAIARLEGADAVAHADRADVSNRAASVHHAGQDSTRPRWL
jgi:hypothetical protein